MATVCCGADAFRCMEWKKWASMLCTEVEFEALAKLSERSFYPASMAVRHVGFIYIHLGQRKDQLPRHGAAVVSSGLVCGTLEAVMVLIPARSKALSKASDDARNS